MTKRSIKRWRNLVLIVGGLLIILSTEHPWTDVHEYFWQFFVVTLFVYLIAALLGIVVERRAQTKNLEYFSKVSVVQKILKKYSKQQEEITENNIVVHVNLDTEEYFFSTNFCF